MAEEPEIKVQMMAAYVPVSTELMLAYGLITEEDARAQGWTPPPPLPPTPWRRRLRWWLAERWDRIKLARRVLAGDDIHRNCDG